MATPQHEPAQTRKLLAFSAPRVYQSCRRTSRRPCASLRFRASALQRPRLSLRPRATTAVTAQGRGVRITLERVSLWHVRRSVRARAPQQLRPSTGPEQGLDDRLGFLRNRRHNSNLRVRATGAPPPSPTPASLSLQHHPARGATDSLEACSEPSHATHIGPRISANSYAAKLGGYAHDGVAAGRKRALGALL